MFFVSGPGAERVNSHDLSAQVLGLFCFVLVDGTGAAALLAELIVWDVAKITLLASLTQVRRIGRGKVQCVRFLFVVVFCFVFHVRWPREFANENPTQVSFVQAAPSKKYGI